ncbi:MULTISPECIES: Wzz/FepE/Etk N-terminal domain-containing protein [Pseudomonas]|uniref:Wzz/FepE/Etk N-terminal domain-containing protein n=1 Tax=Pseudomonas TaxID=286 RepID=UPI00025E89EA|nr:MULTISPECIES: Wzz/FepE/Etk N-terminal domain-containing protein [Pseudomonas]AFJ55306.1 chain length determinant protein [Pseudomonas fluorescens A506]MDN5428688.1 Wzz/FepE/Etk N-terminal domain-containing protein [Pseudomonadales bacterium]AIB41199.1 hypothetical protein PD374_08985 [Pseudomonas sp. WCS374]MDF3190948.1 Wzz/FepE/Etk N-terminal domain-containing protein [Pseudomonas paracarnis]MDV3056139.1 Wzz/FepE/Etk N-terminal domain-containing protein [Pseudomonas paracarnis]
MSSSFRAPPVPQFEISFMAVSEAVLRQKVFIVLVTAAVGLVALAYAFIATPVYQVSSVLRPAALNELDALNRSEIYSLPPGEALTRVGAALESYETRLGFFRENQKLFRAFERPGRTLEQSFEEFNRNSISLSLPDPKKTDILSSFIRIEMNYPKDVDGVSILNGFVNYAINTEREHIAADLNVIVKNRLNELNGKLDAARSNYNNDKEARVASLQESNNLRRAQLRDELKALRAQLKTERYDRVAYLNEAIGIAKSLGIRKPTTPTSLGEADRAGSSTTMRTEVNNQQIPLYFMGTEALEAERSVLQQRKSDDFTAKRVGEIAKELQLLENNREIEILNSRQNEDIFLAGVQSLRAEAVRLQGLAIDMSRLKLVTIDKQALEPINPIKPNRKLIIIFGLLLGGVLGIAIVAIRSILSQQRAARPVLLVSNTVV